MLHSSQRDNLSETKKSRKAHFQGLQKLWNAVRCAGFQTVCNTNINDMYRTFSEKSGNVLLRVSTSGATDSEYVEMMLASIETYLLDGIAPARHEQDCFAICEWHRLFIKFY